jgi:hypothetical protein
MDKTFFTRVLEKSIILENKFLVRIIVLEQSSIKEKNRKTNSEQHSNVCNNDSLHNNLITMCFSSLVWICLYKLLLKVHKGMQNGFFTSSSLYIYLFCLNLLRELLLIVHKGTKWNTLVILSFSYLVWIWFACVNCC